MADKSDKPPKKPLRGAEVEVERTDGRHRVGRVRGVNPKGIVLDVSAEGGEHPDAFVTWEETSSTTAGSGGLLVKGAREGP